MPVKKVNIADIPKDKLDELQPLLQSKCEYVVIGKNIYELYPTPATKLLNVLSKIVTLIKEIQLKKKKEAEDLGLNEEEIKAYMRVTQTDLLSDVDSVNTLKEILGEMLDGIDKEDMDNMTTGQLAILINKLIEININTLPPSAKDKLLQTSKDVIGGSDIREEGTDKKN